MDHIDCRALLAVGLSARVTLGCESSEAEAQPIETPVYYVYLAGPEVFLDDAVEAGAEKKALIEELSDEAEWPFELKGLYPLDNEIPDFKPDPETGIRIYHANMAQIRQASAVLANMVRFRSPSMDVGTAFEMGVARGMNKPVFAYYEAEPFYGAPEEPGLYVDRVAEFYGMDEPPAEDPDGIGIENFGMADNLMMMGAIDDAGYGIETDFEKAVSHIAVYLTANPPPAAAE
jgi:nucleoside 2-deoxyribosyltransferase